MLATTPPDNTEAGRCSSVLAQSAFTGLKAILDHVSHDGAKLCAEIKAARDYEDLLARLGYKLVYTNQIHIQDCYWRLGPAGGISAVLPYYDIPTQSSFPTLVNTDGTVTTTRKAMEFFNNMLAQLQRQLSS
jgi:hypothetical protein